MQKTQFLFTYIIGYRHSPDRINNFKRVIDWVSRFNGVELIIVEQDNTPKMNSQDLRGKYIFTQTNMPYNRSWAFNVGLRYSTTNRIFFADSDIIMNPEHLISCINELDKYEVINPYKKIIDTTQVELSLDNEKLWNLNRGGRGENDNQKINFSGGLVLFRKESIMRIGGFPEEFIGWGGEDNAVTNKIDRFLSKKEMSYNAIHLWHQPSIPDRTYYARNLDILNKMVNMDNDKMMFYINSVLPKIGSINKYYESDLFLV